MNKYLVDERGDREEVVEGGGVRRRERRGMWEGMGVKEG